MNLKEISKYLSDNKLWDKNFKSFSPEQMEEFCNVALDACEEYSPPYLRKVTRNGKEEFDLVIPSDAPRKFRHWQGGQSAEMTAIELGADRQTIEKYSHREGQKH